MWIGKRDSFLQARFSQGMSFRADSSSAPEPGSSSDSKCVITEAPGIARVKPQHFAERVAKTRMKGWSEEAALIIGVGRSQRRLHAALQVQSRPGQQGSVLADSQQRALLHDE